MIWYITMRQWENTSHFMNVFILSSSSVFSCSYSHHISILLSVLSYDFYAIFLKIQKKTLLTLYNLAYFKTCTKLKVVCNMKCMYIYCKLCTETIYKFVLLKIKLVCKRFQTWCTLNNFISMKDKKNWFHFPCNQE